METRSFFTQAFCTTIVATYNFQTSNNNISTQWTQCVFDSSFCLYSCLLSFRAAMRKQNKACYCMQYFLTNMRKSLSFSITNFYAVVFSLLYTTMSNIKSQKNYIVQRHHNAEWDFHGFLLIETIERANERERKIGNTIQHI